jgi:L-seryl-tRNA(Ser) seleniumtransferase
MFVEIELERKTSETLKLLPAIDSILHSTEGKSLLTKIGTNKLTELARSSVDELRREILGNKFPANASREALLDAAIERLKQSLRDEQVLRLQRVINATGVVIHTNLGRSPLSENAKRAIAENAGGYCNLEYDLQSGSRGKRGEAAEKMLADLCGAEAAIIVNNCAAACVLVLTALSNGSEAVISRGEMVEIGGDFRVPDVMIQSGAILREVGSTNRTKLKDYENAINENTRLIVKVHPSNYRIIGFTAMPKVSELAKLAKANKVLLYEDAGSGAMFDLSKYGLIDEPIISESISAGADVVTFSGDKLLGGVQSGLIVGRREIIEKLRKHPLYRALRVDKMIYAALEATLESFQKETHFEEIPTLRMISMSKDEVEKRAIDFTHKLQKNSSLVIELADGNSVIGGGSAPAIHPKTKLILLQHKKLSTNLFERRLRLAELPVITRIQDDKLAIDLRSVSETEETELLEILLKCQQFEVSLASTL